MAVTSTAIAVTTGTSRNTSPPLSGPNICSDWSVTTRLTPAAIRSVMDGDIPGVPDAPDNAADSPHRAVITFANDPNRQEGIAFVDPGGEVHVARITTDPRGGWHTLNMGLGKGSLILSGVGFNGYGQPEQALYTAVEAVYKVGDGKATHYDALPTC